MRTIVDCSALAYATFDNKAEAKRLWRYLNLLHVAGYCGLSSVYTANNFFVPLCEEHQL